MKKYKKFFAIILIGFVLFFATIAVLAIWGVIAEKELLKNMIQTAFIFCAAAILIYIILYSFFKEL